MAKLDKVLVVRKAGARWAVQHRLEWEQAMGACLMAVPKLLNGTALLPEEFRNNLWTHFGLQVLNLLEQCNGCGAHFTVDHVLNCGKSSLVL